MSFFSRLSFFLFFVSWIRDWMLVFLLRKGGESEGVSGIVRSERTLRYKH